MREAVLARRCLLRAFLVNLELRLLHGAIGHRHRERFHVAELHRLVMSGPMRCCQFSGETFFKRRKAGLRGRLAGGAPAYLVGLATTASTGGALRNRAGLSRT